MDLQPVCVCAGVLSWALTASYQLRIHLASGVLRLVWRDLFPKLAVTLLVRVLGLAVILQFLTAAYGDNKFSLWAFFGLSVTWYIVVEAAATLGRATVSGSWRAGAVLAIVEVVVGLDISLWPEIRQTCEDRSVEERDRLRTKHGRNAKEILSESDVKKAITRFLGLQRWSFLVGGQSYRRTTLEWMEEYPSHPTTFDVLFQAVGVAGFRWNGESEQRTFARISDSVAGVRIRLPANGGIVEGARIVEQSLMGMRVDGPVSSLGKFDQGDRLEVTAGDNTYLCEVRRVSGRTLHCRVTEAG